MGNCAWLIDNNRSTGLTLRVSEFDSECGWDFLHIFDGEGTDGEQLAALCGKIKNPFEISLSSKSAFVFFLSDIASNHKGFNISILHNRCAYDCHGSGQCVDGACVCNKGYIGKTCETRVCTTADVGQTGPCNGVDNKCLENLTCQCYALTMGIFCQGLWPNGLWETIVSVDQDARKIAGRASHAAVIADTNIYVVGGDSFKNVKGFNSVEVYNTVSNTWTALKSSGTVPENRYDHTLVRYKTKLYMFGGVINRNQTTSELWSLDVGTGQWTLETPNNQDLTMKPIPVAGHSAHVVEKLDKMFVFFGYNPHRRFIYDVQVYDFLTGKWSTVDVKAHVYGRYGHSSVYYHTETQDVVLVYGGISDPPESSNNITDTLMQFDIKSGTWTTLNSSGTPIFQHAATIINGIMVITGGNSDSRSNRSNQPGDCFQGIVLNYDIECKQWFSESLSDPSQTALMSRYGHSLVSNEDHAYIIGGYNGQMLTDIVMLTPADCQTRSNTSPEECLSVHGSVRCDWANNRCFKYIPETSSNLGFREIIKNAAPKTGRRSCPGEAESAQSVVAVCEELHDCLSCASQSGCGWCVAGSQCLSNENAECVDGMGMIRAYTKCSTAVAVAERPRPCHMALDCSSCKILPHCNWFGFDSRNSCISLSDQARIISELSLKEAEKLAAATVPVKINPTLIPTGLPIGMNLSMCPLSCADYGGCKECVANHCMWCGNQKRCVNTESYLMSFPYGQCYQWTTNYSTDGGKDQCEIDSSECSMHKTCSDCQLGPDCGWMDDGENTGMGVCLSGNYNGPHEAPPEFQPSSWWFVGCPQCQCNGHSECVLSSKSLIETLVCSGCRNNTIGPHCETCAPGYFGDARNGGVCQECECIGNSDGCDPSSGVCHCVTKGVIGDKCDRCENKYIGDPVSGKPCFYELTVDFIFTFKLKNEDQDKYVNEIFLFSMPYKRDTDVTFQINCDPLDSREDTAMVSLNLTSNIFDGRPGTPRMKIASAECSKQGIRRQYLANDPGYAFGTETNTTFFLRVFNFSTPYEIKISFAQSPPINWVLFFVIFAACFIVLLVLAGLLWMVKLRIEAYRQRQQQITEIVQMAQRPFQTVRIDMTGGASNKVATPICIEPRNNYRAGVFTLAVRLPTGGKPYTPNSTSGMALASALCLLNANQEQMLRAVDEKDARPKRKTNLTRYFQFLRRNDGS